MTLSLDSCSEVFVLISCICFLQTAVHYVKASPLLSSPKNTSKHPILVLSWTLIFLMLAETCWIRDAVSLSIAQFDLGVNLLRCLLLGISWQCVNLQLNAPEQQSDKTFPFTEVLTLAHIQVNKSIWFSAPGSYIPNCYGRSSGGLFFTGITKSSQNFLLHTTCNQCFFFLFEKITTSLPLMTCCFTAFSRMFL